MNPVTDYRDLLAQLREVLLRCGSIIEMADAIAKMPPQDQQASLKELEPMLAVERDILMTALQTIDARLETPELN